MFTIAPLTEEVVDQDLGCFLRTFSIAVIIRITFNRFVDQGHLVNLSLRTADLKELAGEHHKG